MKKIILVIISLSLFSLAGCSTIGKIKDGYDKGKVVYTKAEKAWKKGKEYYDKHCGKPELEQKWYEKYACKRLDKIKKQLEDK